MAEKFNWKEMSKTLWKKLSLSLLKAFRGLLCEKKDGGWELSKGNAAFWVVFTHCMHVWNGSVKNALLAAAPMATNTEEMATEASMLDNITAAITNMSVGTGVPEQEFYLLMALLGYAALKVTKGSVTNLVSAARGNG